MSIVKDLSLSPSGLQKIQWVRDFMPALGGIEARFEQVTAQMMVASKKPSRGSSSRRWRFVKT